MNKQELINEMAEGLGIPKKDVDRALTELADIVQDELARGNEVLLPGIGKLKTKQSAARTGRNPATGEEMEIPARTAVKFVVAKALKDAVQ